jgi:hypothetical protein
MTASGVRRTVRRLRVVFSSTSAHEPAKRTSDVRTSRLPPARSTAGHVRPSNSPWRAPVVRRRSYLRDQGISIIPDLYGQDAFDDENDPTGSIRFWENLAAETRQNIEYERETTRLVNLANDHLPRTH